MILIALYLRRCFKPLAEEERTTLVLREKSSGQFGTKFCFDGHVSPLCTERAVFLAYKIVLSFLV